jgi:hypothetical protein
MAYNTPASADAWNRFCEIGNTRALVWHDAYAEWEALADPSRVVLEDCRWRGWGETPDEAIAAMLESFAAVGDGATGNGMYRGSVTRVDTGEVLYDSGTIRY